MKAFLIASAAVVLVAAIAGVSIVYAQRQATGLPENTPSAYLATDIGERDKPVIVFVGDSLTHAAVSADYIEMIAERGIVGYELVNAGVNSQLAYNVTTRLDEIIACDPDIVIALVGTNDANSRMSLETRERLMKEQSLPQVPDADWFRENLTDIARKLKNNTDARIAFLSIPTMGENLSDPAFVISKEYSRIIGEVAAEAGVSYLPLHEAMVEHLIKNPSSQKHDFSKTRSLMMKSVLQRYIFGLSWEKIGESNGFALHTDHLHLNEKGATLIADLVTAFILEETD